MKAVLKPPAPAIAAFFARHAHLVALALFAAVGAAVFDDYGFTLDEENYRKVGYAAFNYVFGDADELTGYHLGHEIYYGVAFELPLVAAERLLGLEDPRGVYLLRRLLTHLFFLAGGFFAWLLAYRLFGNRLVALFAMLVFLLHPRVYGHSFPNSRDVPFLCMFMVSLYLVHRAFRRDSVYAFALCGAGIGLLANIRIMGVMLLPAVLGMLALDAFHAMRRGGGGVKRALAGMGAFSAAFGAALYATWPLLWREPLAWMDALRVLSAHPTHIPTLFRGGIVQWPHIPWDFVPTWILITTPPVFLALAAIGAGCVAGLCAADWRGMFANSTARFALFAAACLVLPVAAVIALNSNSYNDWRFMHFLWAPICVLAAFGLRTLAAIPKPRLRAAAFALAALGIAAVVLQMAALHPYQSEYFSPALDKTDLAERWDMNYWRASYKEALDELLKIQPAGRVAVPDNKAWARRQVRNFFRREDRARFAFAQRFPSYRVAVIARGVAMDGVGYSVPVSRREVHGVPVWRRDVYGVPLAAIFAVRAESEAAFDVAYADARTAEPVASAGGFDIRADGGSLIYIKEACDESDTGGRFRVRVFPSHAALLPAAARDAGRGYKELDFNFWRNGGMFGGRCMTSIALPEYPIRAVETYQTDGDSERAVWRAFWTLADAPAASAGGFDIYVNGGTLTYIKRGCGESDARGRFFLSIFPDDQSDLPQDARDAGREHEALNFNFEASGETFGGDCVISRRLPDYPISRIETGQWIPGEGHLWSARIGEWE